MNFVFVISQKKSLSMPDSIYLNDFFTTLPYVEIRTTFDATQSKS